MGVYRIEYLNDIIENQGKLFDLVSLKYSEYDTIDFITLYMKSNTRRYIDQS